MDLTAPKHKGCDCRGFVCHTGPDEAVKTVHMVGKAGGRGVLTNLSAECLRRRSGPFIKEVLA